MRIGLIDADMMWRKHANGRRYGKTKADVFPNLVLMKLSAAAKQAGHEVEWYNPMGGWYDEVYISKVFSDTPETREEIQAWRIFRGGSGYAIYTEDGIEHFDPLRYPKMNGYYPETDHESKLDGTIRVWHKAVRFHELWYATHLSYAVEHIMPDYSLYPMIKDTAIGFLTRGCPRGCGFCHVATKEGTRSYKVANLNEWWSGQKNIVLCDPNILACKDWRDLLTQLADSKAWVDINQGMDARLLTPEKVQYLNRIKLKTIHFAWDNYKQKDAVLRGLRCFKDNFKRKLEKGHFAQVFVLVNYDTTFEQDLDRIYTLRDMDFEPYVMVYNKANADRRYKSLQRYVNQRAIFHRVPTFEEYDQKKAKE